MHQIQLTDELFEDAQRAAKARGFATVDEYIADVITHDVADEVLTLTPDQVIKVREAQEQIEVGKYSTVEELQESLNEQRAAWHQKKSAQAAS